MLGIDPEGTLAEKNSLRIRKKPGAQTKTVTTQIDQRSKLTIDEIISNHNERFEGIGKIRDNKRDKELYVQFSMKPDTVPVTQKPRPVAYYLQEPVGKWPDQGLKEDIFEEVPPGEPIIYLEKD